MSSERYDDSNSIQFIPIHGYEEKDCWINSLRQQINSVDAWLIKILNVIIAKGEANPKFAMVIKFK